MRDIFQPGESCEIFVGTEDAIPIAYTLYHLVGLYLIPIVITGCLYGRVVRVLLHSIHTAKAMTRYSPDGMGKGHIPPIYSGTVFQSETSAIIVRGSKCNKNSTITPDIIMLCYSLICAWEGDIIKHPQGQGHDQITTRRHGKGPYPTECSRVRLVPL